MATYILGKGATLKAKSREELLYLLFKYGQARELNPALNPGQKEYLSSDTSDDGRAVELSLSEVPVDISSSGLAIPDYLRVSAADYTNGTEGTYSQALSWIQTLWEVLEWLHREALKRPEEFDNFSFSIESSEEKGGENATLSASISLGKTIVVSEVEGYTQAKDEIVEIL